MPDAALRNISLDVASGRLLLLVGHNGAGKSTLLRLLNGMVRPEEGSVHICGKSTENRSTAELASDVAITFQNPADQLFASTVFQEVAFGPRNLARTDVDALVDSALRLCGLQSSRERHPYDLLLPERKLLTVASAIAMETPVLAFDEPSAGLSQHERTRLIQAFHELLGRGKTILVISHDLGLFLPLANQVVALEEGRIVFSGGVQELEQMIPILRKTGVRLPFPVRLQRMMLDVR
jgi:energy-coupling factor transporter ATP-binding protein EcfA2